MTEEERKKTSPDLGDENTVLAGDKGNLFSVSYRESIEGNEEATRIKEQIRNNLEWLTKEPIAADVIVDVESAKVRDYMEKDAVELFKKIGFHVDKQNYGDILVDEDHLHTAFKYVNNAAEGAAYQTLPRVLKRGKEIGYHNDHKNRGFPTRTFAAPVKINGQQMIVAAVVQEMKNRPKSFHVLRVLAFDGRKITTLDMQNADPTTLVRPQSNEAVGPDIESASNNSIRSSSENSNPQNGRRASVEVGGEDRNLTELRWEYKERTEAFNRANESNDPDYDYTGELRRINELEQLMQTEGGTAEDDTSSTASGPPSPQGEGSTSSTAGGTPSP